MACAGSRTSRTYRRITEEGPTWVDEVDASQNYVAYFDFYSYRHSYWYLYPSCIPLVSLLFFFCMPPVSLLYPWATQLCGGYARVFCALICFDVTLWTGCDPPPYVPEQSEAERLRLERERKAKALLALHRHMSKASQDAMDRAADEAKAEELEAMEVRL